jgi:hypothetical protein
MPKRSTKQHGDEPATPVEATTGAATDAGAAEGTEAEAGDEQQPEFENRAARRAKGKGGNSQPQPHGEQSHFARRGSVQTPRQYGRRRSG